MSKLYVWKEGTVRFISDYGSIVTENKGVSVEEFYVVDINYSTDMPEDRYGMWTSKGGWTITPIKEFPPEFRTQLLLLGVS